MKYYVPILELAVISPAQTGPRDKFGGLPWGIPVSKWPYCASCKHSMALIAQLFHDDQRLDLGAAGRCLFIFMCSAPPSACDTYDSKSGASASVVLEPEELGSGLVRPPDAEASWPVWSTDCCGHSRATEDRVKVWINVEARVLSWQEADDGVDSATAAAFMDEEQFDRLPRETIQRAHPGNKLGGVPSWVQYPPAMPGWRFCAQFESALAFPPPMPGADELGTVACTGIFPNHSNVNPKVQRHDGPRYASTYPDREGWFCEWASFGTGTAYLLMKPNGKAPPSFDFFWQCG